MKRLVLTLAVALVTALSASAQRLANIQVEARFITDKMAVELGRSVRPDLSCGICGEHGGDPSSVEFCHKIGLDYVSCSPFRVPIARLAAAQAALQD